MKTINHTQLQRETKAILDIVSIDKETVIVHRPKQEDVVIIPLSEWNAITETNYLLQSNANKENLLDSIKQVKEGKTIAVKIQDLWK